MNPERVCILSIMLHPSMDAGNHTSPKTRRDGIVRLLSMPILNEFEETCMGYDDVSFIVPSMEMAKRVGSAVGERMLDVLPARAYLELVDSWHTLVSAALYSLEAFEDGFGPIETWDWLWRKVKVIV